MYVYTPESWDQGLNQGPCFCYIVQIWSIDVQWFRFHTAVLQAHQKNCMSMSFCHHLRVLRLPKFNIDCFVDGCASDVGVLSVQLILSENSFQHFCVFSKLIFDFVVRPNYS